MKNNLAEAPTLLRGEDLYLKSGGVALYTENAKNSYFDDFKAEQVDCFQDPFDPE